MQYTPRSKEIDNSFSTMVATPYSKGCRSHAQSVESPYTSLGSVPSSYASILQPNHGFHELRARAERANALHESKSKAVMDALKSLQEKIQQLESDRAEAEFNLKSLAGETKDYKETLRQQKETANNNDEILNKELEVKLGKAQDRCEALEQQLRSMRSMMQHSNQSNTSNYPSVFSSPVLSHSMNGAVSSNPVNISSTNATSTHFHSPAIVKLQALEKQHQKLTISQSHTENKLRELEDKMREECHQRKLLQDKASQLQKAVSLKASTQENPSQDHALEKNAKTCTQKPRKKSSKCPAKMQIDTGSPSNHPSKREEVPSRLSSRAKSGNHCLLDLEKIPFVVGQSTGQSHSLGANIQNILSIMKSQNKLCLLRHPPSVNRRPPPDTHRQPPSGLSSRASRSTPVMRTESQGSLSVEELDELLSTLQDEFAQLGFEHRELTSRLKDVDSPDVISEYEKELIRVVEKMELKSQQINTIREHIKRTKLSKIASRKLQGEVRRNSVRPRSVKSRGEEQRNSVIVNDCQQVEVVTTIRTAKSPIKTKADTSPHSRKFTLKDKKEILKTAKKLQTTLRKDDLVWR